MPATRAVLSVDPQLRAMAVYASLRTAGVELCRQAGYTVADEPGPTVADPGPDARGITGEPRPIAVEPLSAATVGPESVVPRLAGAVGSGRDCLFVVPAPEGSDAVARTVASVLAAPTGLAADEPEGRQFYSGPDRVPLSDGTYACARAPADTLQWREVAAGADHPRLALSVGTEVAAVLDGVDALATPDRERFRHAYARSDTGRFEVFERGEVVDSFGGVAAMRRGGYTPVSMPLVPEHLFPADTDPGRSWAVATAGEDPTVFTPDGTGVWP